MPDNEYKIVDKGLTDLIDLTIPTNLTDEGKALVDDSKSLARRLLRGRIPNAKTRDKFMRGVAVLEVAGVSVDLSFLSRRYEEMIRMPALSSIPERLDPQAGKTDVFNQAYNSFRVKGIKHDLT